MKSIIKRQVTSEEKVKGTFLSTSYNSQVVVVTTSYKKFYKHFEGLAYSIFKQDMGNECPGVPIPTIEEVRTSKDFNELIKGWCDDILGHPRRISQAYGWSHVYIETPLTSRNAIQTANVIVNLDTGETLARKEFLEQYRAANPGLPQDNEFSY